MPRRKTNSDDTLLPLDSIDEVEEGDDAMSEFHEGPRDNEEDFDIYGHEPEATFEQPGQSAAKRQAGRKRQPVVPPANVNDGISLYDYLMNCTPPLEKKIIDISMAQAQVPENLLKETAQEIRLQWSLQRPDFRRFKPGQIASYAHRMARHCALRMRRELGSSVRLPGSAFRKRKDGTTYVNMRHLSEPIRWEDIEGWLDTDGAADTDFQMAGAGAAVSEALVHYELSSDSSGESEEEIMKQRLELVKKKAHKMEPDQLEILVLLIRGETYDDIQRRKNIKRAMLLNIIEDATEILYSKD